MQHLKVFKSLIMLKPLCSIAPNSYFFITSRSYTKQLYARAKAEENMHFLRIRYKQLKKLLLKVQQLEKKQKSESISDGKNSKTFLKTKCMVARSLKFHREIPQQVRQKSEREIQVYLKEKSSAVWRRQIGELIRKRELLALIAGYIQLQENYVNTSLRNNKQLLVFSTAKS